MCNRSPTKPRISFLLRTSRCMAAHSFVVLASHVPSRERLCRSSPSRSALSALAPALASFPFAPQNITDAPFSFPLLVHRCRTATHLLVYFHRRRALLSPSCQSPSCLSMHRKTSFPWVVYRRRHSAQCDLLNRSLRLRSRYRGAYHDQNEAPSAPFRGHPFCSTYATAAGCLKPSAPPSWTSVP